MPPPLSKGSASPTPTSSLWILRWRAQAASIWSRVLWRAHVRHEHLRPAYALRKSLLLDRFHRIAAVVELPDDGFDFSKAALERSSNSSLGGLAAAFPIRASCS